MLNEVTGVFWKLLDSRVRQGIQQEHALVNGKFWNSHDIMLGKLSGDGGEAGGEQGSTLCSTDNEIQGVLELPGIIDDEQHSALPNHGMQHAR